MSRIGNLLNNVNQAGREMSIIHNRHARTQLSPELEQYNHSFRSAYLVGCGGIGAWMGFFMAASDLADELHLFDSDKVEAHNHSRFMYPNELTGEHKSLALAATIKQSRPDIRVFTYERDFIPNSDIDTLLHQRMYTHDMIAHQNARDINLMVTEVDDEQEPLFEDHVLPISRQHRWSVFLHAQPKVQFVPIIDATDNPAFQQDLGAAVQRQADIIRNQFIGTFRAGTHTTITRTVVIPLYLRVSYNGSHHITITGRNSSWAMDQATGRYDVIPSFALPAILASACGLYGLLQRVQEETLDLYREIQDVLYQDLTTGNDPILATNGKALELIFKAMLHQQMVTVPWLRYCPGGRLRLSQHCGPDVNLDEPHFQVLDPHTSSAQLWWMVEKMLPSLFPTVEFGHTEHTLSMGKTEEATHGKEEEEEGRLHTSK
jgi:hypothetical protein